LCPDKYLPAHPVNKLVNSFLAVRCNFLIELLHKVGIFGLMTLSFGKYKSFLLLDLEGRAN